MNTIGFREFDRLYQERVRATLEFWTPTMQDEIAAHCHGWRCGAFDFETYLRLSAVRFYKAYRDIAKNSARRSACDIGGFWGVFPTTLAALGFEATMTEALRYYSRSFDRLFNHIAELGVKIIDYDPFEEGTALPGTFDAVTLMAVLEHYPHSPKILLDNLKSMISPNGLLYIEVPNLAFWPKRIAFLAGHTPLASIEHIYKSKVPFIGHHHEYTLAELRELADLSGLRIISEHCYNYSSGFTTLKSKLRRPLTTIANTLSPSTRECLSIACIPKGE